MPVSYLFSNLLISKGRSSVYMWCTLALCVAQLLCVMLCVPFGIGRMVQVYTAVNVFWLGVWFYFARREIDLRLREAVADVAPYVLLSVAIVYATHLATAGIGNLYVSLLVKVLAVAVAYCGALWLLRSTVFREAIAFVTKRKIE